jgi:hypothetical protein
LNEVLKAMAMKQAQNCLLSKGPVASYRNGQRALKTQKQKVPLMPTLCSTLQMSYVFLLWGSSASIAAWAAA